MEDECLKCSKVIAWCQEVVSCVACTRRIYRKCTTGKIGPKLTFDNIWRFSKLSIKQNCHKISLFLDCRCYKRYVSRRQKRRPKHEVGMCICSRPAIWTSQPQVSQDSHRPTYQNRRWTFPSLIPMPTAQQHRRVRLEIKNASSDIRASACDTTRHPRKFDRQRRLGHIAANWRWRAADDIHGRGIRIKAMPIKAGWQSRLRVNS